MTKPKLNKSVSRFRPAEIGVKSSDSLGGISSADFSINVINTAPIAAFGNSGAVNEGSTTTVSFSGQNDPSTTDTTAGFQYAFDFNNDGTFDSGDGTFAGSITNASVTVAASYLTDGPGIRTVKGRIIDKDGGFTDYTTSITINNVVPSNIALSLNAATINEGQSVTLSGSYVDPGIQDSQTISVNWGDGSASTTTSSSAAVIDQSKLLAFYTFEGDSQDVSGHGRNGTVVGATLTSLGYQGSAYTFNGSSDYTGIPININPSVLPKLTMGAWVNATSNSPVRQIISHDNGGYDRGIGIDYRGGGNPSNWSAFTGSGVLGGSPVATNQWVFVAVAYDQAARTETLYVNGTAYFATNVQEGEGWSTLRIGSNPSYGEYFQGTIDNVFFYGDTMTAAQIASIGTIGASALTGSGFTLSHQYVAPPPLGSTYTITTTVTDKDGGSGSATTSVTVNEVPLTGTGTSLPSIPSGSVFSSVPEAANYGVIYEVNIPTAANFGSTVAYAQDNSAQVAPAGFSRVAYALELNTTNNPADDKWVWVSFDRPSNITLASKLGVPNVSSGEFYNRSNTSIANMNVYSNATGVTTGSGISTGNIEFWPSNYGMGNDYGVPGANTGNYDFGDGGASGVAGYGSMQIHNYGAGQTLFGFNRWGGAFGTSEIGIGNQVGGSGHPDWTFAANAGNYVVKHMYVLAYAGAGGFTVNATGGVGSGLQTISQFRDPGGALPNISANYAASINWGDGSSPSTGTISYDSSTGVFSVKGQHTYANFGTFIVTTSINHGTAPTLTAISSAVITEATSLIVNTTADVSNAFDGVTSLREAITLANSNSVGDTVKFNISGGGTQTITLASALPAISGADTVDLNNNNISLVGGVLTGSGVITNTAATGTATLTENGTGTFNGVIQNGASAFTAITVAGGTLTLAGANTFTGAININAGKLTFSNQLVSSTAVNIASGATLEYAIASGSLRQQNNITFTGTGTLLKSGAGEIDFGGPNGSVTWQLGAGGLIDVQAGIVVGGSYVKDFWTTNLSNLNIASGAVFSGVEANVRIDQLTGSGTLYSGYSGAGYSTFTLGVNNGGSIFAGVIANTPGLNVGGNFTKIGTGTLTLSGANTYSGGTNVNAGILTLANNSAAGTGAIVVSSTTGGVGITGTRVAMQGGITVNNSLSLPSNATGNIRSALYANDVNNTWSGPITLNGNGIIHFAGSPGGSLRIIGGVSGSSFTGTFGGARGSNTFTTTIASTINLPIGRMYVTDNANLIVSSTGNSVPTVQIAYGILKLGANNALPTNTNLVIGQNIVNADFGTLDMAGFSQQVSAITNLASDVSHEVIGNSSTTSDSTLTFSGSGSLEKSTYSGVIRDNLGSGTRKTALTVNAGTLTLAGTSTYSGATTVNSFGTLIAGSTAALSPNSSFDVNGALTLNGISNTIGSLNGSGTVANATSAVLPSAATLTVANGGGFAGNITGSNTSLSLSASTLVLSGAANSYGGTTTIIGGKLLVNGTNLGTGLVNVNNSTILGGTGVISGQVNVNGSARVAIGSSPETLAVGTVTFESTTFFDVKIGGSIPGDGTTGYDQLVVTGGVNLANATLNLSSYGGFTPTTGQSFRIIDNDGVDAVSGTFEGLPNGVTIPNFFRSGFPAYISYSAGTGNDVVITVNSAPVVAVDLAAVTVHEGGNATNTGTFSDADGNRTVTITASIGNVTYDSSGKWNWSLGAADGPAGPFTVIITATDDRGVAATATFTYAIDNVSPTISLSGNATVNEGEEYTLNLGVVTDPGQDTITNYKINWGDGVIDSFVGNPANTTAKHTFADGPSSQTNKVTVTDEDGTFLAGSLDVQVLNIAPTATFVGNSKVNYGEIVTVVFSNQLDKSSPDTNAGFRYAYLITQNVTPPDFTGITYTSGSTTNLSREFAELLPGDYTIYGRIIDKDHAFRDYTVAVEVKYVDIFTVTNTNDDGVGSLRRAISLANHEAGSQSIKFNLSSNGPFRIRPSSPFPTIADAVVIDGSTQLGSSRVELDGTFAGANTDGLTILSGDSTIHSLAINRFGGTGIRIAVGNNNTIAGNYIGTSFDGTQDQGNGSWGIIVNSSFNFIGGIGAGGGNVISGNDQGGIKLYGLDTSYNSVLGNIVGLDKTGTVPLANSQDGVQITEGAKHNTIGGSATGAGNVVSGNTNSGVSIAQAGVGNKVQGNFIGTDISGSLSIGNASAISSSGAGVTIASMAGNNVVIGVDGDGIQDANEGNLISGNLRAGIRIEGGNSQLGNHVVAGNRIGVNVGGTLVLPNQSDGIQIVSSSNNRIGTNSDGTSDALEANIIAGNKNLGDNPDGVAVRAAGISVSSKTNSPADLNKIAGNFIGTDKTGVLALGNQGAGIRIENATNTVVGSNTAIGQNLVYFGGGNGIEISDRETPSVTAIQSTVVLVNSFRANTGLAIDLGADGNTLNDNGDTDGIQNFPALTSAPIVGGNLTIRGFAKQGQTFELYIASPESDTRFGEGQTLLALFTEGSAADADSTTGQYGPVVNSVTVSLGTVSGSAFEFTVPLLAGLGNGSLLTVRAIGPTSEFGPLVIAGQLTSQLAPVITIPPSVALDAGGRLQASGSFADPDSSAWTATVDYADGTGVKPLTLKPDRTFDLDHVYVATGTFNVKVRITDNSLVTTEGILPVTVIYAVPTADANQFVPSVSTVDEGQSLQLSGPLNLAVANKIEIAWGDGSPVQVLSDFAFGTKSFNVPHVYQDDSNPKNSPSAVDIYQIQVRVVGPGGSATTQLGLLPITVRNVKPSSLVVATTLTTLDEGGTVGLSGSFVDPGVLDTHTVTIDWGDGTILTQSLPADITDLSQLSENIRSHIYANNPAAGIVGYTLSVEVTDDDEPNPESAAKYSELITVNNVVPSAVTFTLSNAAINEGGSVVIAGESFIDPGQADTHSVFIDWGDGSGVSANLAAGVTDLSSLPVDRRTHVYANDPSGTAPSYSISVKVADNDEPTLYGEHSTSVVVSNVAPVLSNVKLNNTAPINEGDSVQVTGTFTDVGQMDRHQVNVTWGDGTTSLATVNLVPKAVPLAYSFLADHTYGDNFDPANVVVKVEDGRYDNNNTFERDGGFATSEMSLQVNNVAPKAFIAPTSTSTPTHTLLQAQVTDPGFRDTFAYIWSINGVVVQNNGDPAPQNLLLDTTTFTTPPRIRVEIRDDDGGVGAFEALAIFGTDAAETIIITNSGSLITARKTITTIVNGIATSTSQTVTATAFSTNVLVMGFDGEDLLDASALSEEYSAILDGGAAKDYLKGGAGPSVFFAHIGDDTVEGGKCHDIYKLTPNSTLTVIDHSPDNTLDFSLANFSDGTGLTFDLSKVSTTTLVPQLVSTSGGKLHIVQAEGNFSELVGSDFGDTLIAANKSTVSGGGGKDILKVATGATDAILRGGSDDDVFSIDLGVSISNINFGGDDGVDTLINFGTIDGLTFSGGADDDVFSNAWGGVITSLNFGGDDGADVFTNLGTLTDMTFSGGADDDVFSNFLDGVITGLSFGGDDGADVFMNLGTISDMTFNGGADDDVFTNALGGEITGLNFGGDDGADIFYNFGSATDLTFTGGADDDVFTNEAGATIAGLNFGGDDGADTFTNLGDVTGSLVFSGGADDDVFTNALGATISGLNFGGDDGADTLTNYGILSGNLVFNGGADDDVFTNLGTVSAMTFSGGADDDVFTNAPDAFVSGLNFGGDDGADIFRNFGTATDLTFSGGADDDVFTNATGATLIGLNFGGHEGDSDAGADTFRNFGSATAVQFRGGADDDVFINATDATISGLNFGGDDGADTLTNYGILSGNLVFNGGADDDVFTNVGTVSAMTFNGGADDDIFTNATGATLSGLNFGGDDGADIFNNFGTATDLTFVGGADDDVFTNAPDATITGLNFGGDDRVGGTGADSFRNFGSATAVKFLGGADDDVFTNAPGATINGLNFGGDDGADSLTNYGILAGDLVFTGGADDDVFTNAPGAIVGGLSFSGDDGADTLLNYGTATSLVFNGDDGADVFVNSGLGTIGDLTFSGGADDDVFQNNGSVASIVFKGDNGKDRLLNYGNFSNLLFTGGADDDLFANFGESVGAISFQGDMDPGKPGYDPTVGGNDTLIVRGSGDGNALTQVKFNGGTGKDTFLNSARGFSSLNFIGGADDDVFVNTAANISGINFSGDDGADTLVNTGTGLSGIVFNGGADDDVFINSGPVLANITFNGGADNDRFWNKASAVISSHLVFNGDDGADLFINDAASVGDMTFTGGADDDRFQNNGVNVGSIIVDGGTGADVVINTGSQLASLKFGGGSGKDMLLNRGYDAGRIEMTGDDGADVFVNDGVAAATLVFSGGADDDVFANNGEATSLTFTGGADDDVFQNNGTVESINFGGDDGNDLFQNNGPAVSLVFTGGADDDVFINNGAGVLSINFGGDDGADTFINNGDGLASLVFAGGADGDYLRLQGKGIGNVDYQGGDGNDTFEYNGVAAAGSTITYNGGDGNDFLSWLGSGSSATFNGGYGDDLAYIVGSGNLTLNGDQGDDTYSIVGSPLATVNVGELYSGTNDTSVDMLDFSSFSGGPINVDLRSTLPQSQGNALPGESAPRFTLRLKDGLGVEAIVGTAWADTLQGNARDNILLGAQYLKDSTAMEVSLGTAPLAARRNQVQWVFLDFDSRTDTGEHVYSQEERDAILNRVQSSYSGPNAGAPWFDVKISQDINEIPRRTDDPAKSIDYATIYFNDTPAYGRPGGLASEVDPGNRNFGGSAQVQVNGLLGGSVTAQEANKQLDETQPVGDLDKYAADQDQTLFGDSSVGALKPEATIENFIKLSAKIAAHELAHLLGLRHQDSFGPIGLGIHDPPGGGAYKPSYTGAAGGFESFNHLVGSPASIGSSRFTDLNDLFFGEREAVKLAFARSNPADTTIDESASVGGSHNSATTAESLQFVTLDVPNTLGKGANAAKRNYVQIKSVIGEIKLAGAKSENDWYSFSGNAGELVNIDVLSNSMVGRFGSTPDRYVDTILRVYSLDQNGNLFLVPYNSSFAVNDDQFEPTDSSIIDLRLPADGTYYVEVDTFSRASNDSLSNSTNPNSPLNPKHPWNPANNPSSDNLQNYERFVDTVNDTDIGKYQLVIYSYDSANASDDIDTIKGNGGKDSINGGPGDDYSLSFSLGDTVYQKESETFIRRVAIADRGATNWFGSTVNYGDGSAVENIGVSVDPSDGSLSFSLNHKYVKDDGIYAVSVKIHDDIGNEFVRKVDVRVANAAPTARISAPATVLVNQVVNFQLFADDPSLADTAAGFKYEVDFGNGPITVDRSAGNGTGSVFASKTFSIAGNPEVQVTAIDKDGGRSAAGKFTVNVQQAAAASLATAIDSLIQAGVTEAVVQPAKEELKDLLSALSSLVPHSGGQTFTIIVDSPLEFHGQIATVPSGYRLIINNASFVGASPALTVNGNVELMNDKLSNTTDAPTILMLGGSLKVRSSTIEESTNYSQSAISVLGGTVDLGGSLVIGGNKFIVHGSGNFISNSTLTAMPVTGNNFEVDVAEGNSADDISTAVLLVDKSFAAAILTGRYGSFAISDRGAWTYAASSSHDEFVVGVTYTDSFVVGGQTTITINILGTNDNPTATFANNGSKSYGEMATVYFADQRDADSGVAPEFHYAYSETNTFTGITYDLASGSTSLAIHDYSLLNAGKHTIYARIIDRDNGYSEYSTDISVIKAASFTTVSIAAGAFIYNGSAQTPATVMVNGAGGLSLTSTADYANNANAGTAMASYSYAGDANHEASSDNKNFVIAKATSSTTVTIPAGTFTYRGSAQTPATVTVTGAGGLSLTPTAVYANNTNAGTATASYSFAGDANHEASSNSKNFVIAKATSSTTVTISAGTFTYNGSAQAPATVTVTGAGGLSLTPTAVYANNTNAGTATASYRYAGDVNLEASSDSKNFVIGKASTTTSVTSSVSVSSFGQTVILTATVMNKSTSPVPTGNVQFVIDGANYGSPVALDGFGKATSSVNNLTVGPHAIIANEVNADGNFVNSSGSFTQTVSNLAASSAYILNPTASGAITASGNANVTLPGGIFVDSSSTSAIVVNGNARVNVGGTVQVVGGVSKSGNAMVTKTGTPAATNDPLGSLQPPVTKDLTNYGSKSLGGNTKVTLLPGIYTSISLSGNASVTMSSGNYIILGGGFSVSGNASVSGANVFIFNAGSNYGNNGSTITTGGNFGGITLSGSGTFNLTPKTGSDPYAGILIYQARDNTRALSISGNATVAVNGTIYAASAALTLSGSGTLKDTLVVSSLNVSGNIALTQMAAGSGGSEEANGFANTLLAGDLALYVNNPSGAVTRDMLARIHDAISSIDVLLAPYSVNIVEVSDPTMATVILDYSSMSANGTAADGVLGSYDPSVYPMRITILRGWNWYTGADAAGAAANQYDFQTTVTHEFGHALGLGHSHDAGSPMSENLATGVAHRFLNVSDLNIPSTPEGAEPLMAANSVSALVSAVAVPIEASSRQTLLMAFSRPIFAFPSANGGSGSEQHSNSLQSVALKSVLAEWTSTFGRRDNIEVKDDYFSKTGIAAKIESVFDDNFKDESSVDSSVDCYFANIESDFSLVWDRVKAWKSIDVKKTVKK